jgi:tripartite-type tricarboxylate transporter receptor subunit TctC
MRLAALYTGLALGLALGTSSALAAEFPERPVEFVNPAAAGQGTDILIRAIATKMQETWGQPVVVVNKTGAGGAIAEAYVAAAPADGYTILSIGPSRSIFAANPDPGAPYDQVNGLVPLTQLVRQPMVLFANNDLPAATLPELIELAKKNPGGMNYGSNGPDGPMDLSMRALMEETGTQLVEVAYKSAGDMVVGMLAGDVSVSMASLGFSSQHIRGGKVKALAIADDQRAPQFPDLPTVSEQLGTDFVIRHWQGAFVKAGTPDDIVQKLNEAVVAALNDPEVQKLLTAEGFTVVGNSPAEFAADLTAETAVWSTAMMGKAAN